MSIDIRKLATALAFAVLLIAGASRGQTVAPITGHGVGDGGPARNVKATISGIAIGAGDVYWSQFGRAVLWRASASGDIASAMVTSIPLPPDTGPGGARVTGFTALCATAAYLYGVDQYSHTAWRRPYFGGAVWERVAGQLYMPGDTGRGGLAADALLNAPAGCAVASDGAVYVSEFGNLDVLRIDPTGIVTRYAGGGPTSCSGCQATSARLRSPWGLAVAGDGSVYLADSLANLVQRVTPAGVIETVAGAGTFGTACPSGPALSTIVGQPRAVEIGADGRIFIASAAANCVVSLATGQLARLAGGGQTIPAGPVPATEATIEVPSALRLHGSRLLIGAQGTKQPGLYSVELGAAPPPPTATITTVPATATRTATAVPSTPTRTATRTSTPLPTCDLGQCVPPGGA